MENEKEYQSSTRNECLSGRTVEELVDPMLSAEVIAESEGLYSNTIVARTLMSMRVGAGLSQSEMARKVGCTQPRISNIESATDDRLNIPLIRLYCAILRKPFRAQLADGTKIHVPVPKLERKFVQIVPNGNRFKVAGKTGKIAGQKKPGNTLYSPEANHV